MKLELRRNLFSVLAFVGFIWLIWLINLPLSAAGMNLNAYGLQPRAVSGLPGIFTMPFLHDNLQHLLANTVPLTVLLLMLATTRPNARRVLICLLVLSGVMLWAMGRDRVHVGSSGLVYALTAYLITAGLYERKLASAATAVLVGVLYGGTLFWGLLPTAGEHVSWDGHLLAAVAGAVFGYLTLKKQSHNKPAIDSGKVVVVDSPPLESRNRS